MMRKIVFIFSFFIAFVTPCLLNAQSSTIAERLGYDKETKLLILHADDVGVSHSANMATIKAFEQSDINSASIMVPCPWFPEIAVYVKSHPQYDFGIHLTLTSEWKNYKWGGVLPANEIKSLLDDKGFFYSTVKEVVESAKSIEVEKELKAQIERAIAFGIQPTHLDSHMGTLFATPELFQIYLNLGKAYNIPVFIPMNAAKGFPELLKRIDSKQILVDNYAMMDENRPTTKWKDYYINIIKQLKPGLNEIIVHLAIDNSEMQAVTIDHPDYGSAWRQNDFNVLMSKEFKEVLNKNNIKLITWKKLKTLLNK